MGEPWAVGVDVGGTSVRVAAVSATGAVLDAVVAPVDRRPEAVPFAQLVALVEELLVRVPGAPAGIGVGITGPVDPRTGVVDNPWTLPPGLQGDLLGALASASGLAVRVENDADAAALGEARWGSGAGCEVVVCVTVGTGIGVGTVVRGEPVRGAQATHPEGGHVVVDPLGPACYCGASGCVESLASGPAIVAAAEAAGVVRADGSPPRTVDDVLGRARDGDATAASVLADARRALAAGVRTLVATTAPDAVVLVGGALGDVPATVAEAEAAVRAWPFGPPAGTRVEAGALGGLAGCIGAASTMLAP